MVRGGGVPVVGVLLLGLAGCTLHQDDSARAFGVAFCKHQQACRRVSSAVDCEHPGFWTPWPQELQALREGLVGYSPADAQRCLELLSEVGCIADLEARLFASTRRAVSRGAPGRPSAQRAAVPKMERSWASLAAPSPRVS